MSRHISYVIKLTLLMGTPFLPTTGQAGDLVHLHCETNLVRQETPSSAVSTENWLAGNVANNDRHKTMLDSVLESSWSIVLHRPGRINASDSYSPEIIDEVKEHFEIVLVQLLKANSELIKSHAGKVLSRTNFEKMRVARGDIRFFKPYLDMRIREIDQEIQLAQDQQRYELGVRRQSIQNAITEYAPAVQTQHVEVDWHY